MSRIVFRKAVADDLPFIVGIYVEDAMIKTADDPAEAMTRPYLDALAAIDADPNQVLAVAELDGERVGTIQITYVPGINRGGMWKGLIEGVHIAAAHRNKGLGTELIDWALERCRERGCGMAQLTSNKKRLDAHRFYERHGWQRSHEGFKYYI